MSVSFVAASAPVVAGTTTTAGTAAATPTLPTGSATDDRVFVAQSASNTAGATPAGWTAIFKDVQIGPTATAPGAGVGRRYISAYYRDYDGVWTMPTFSLTSATQNSNAVSATTLRKAATDAWDTPTFSSAGNTSTASTSFSATIPSFTTTSGAMLLTVGGTNDNVTASGQSLTQTGATFANVTERADGGTATGNDVSIKTGTADVTIGATATLTRTATLSAASEGGLAVVQQTVTDLTPYPRYVGKGATTTIAQGSSLSLARPANLAANDIEIAHIYLETPSQVITPPAGQGWTEIGTEATSGGTNTAIYRFFWRRAAGGETAAAAFAHATTGQAGYITRWTNCIASGNPFETEGASAKVGSTGATTTPAASDTTDGPNRMLLFVAANWAGASTWTPPTGFTEVYDSGGEVGSFNTKPQAAAGATGSITATTNLSGPLVARLLILIPAASAVVDTTHFFLSAM